MKSKLVRPHAVAILSMSKEALAESLAQAWDRIESLEADRDDGGYEEPGNVWRGADTPFADNH